MVNKFFKSLFYMCVVTLSFFITFSLISTPTKADTFNFRWAHVTNNTVQMNTNSTYLTGNWGTRYSQALANWNTSSARISLTDTTWSRSNVDMFTIDRETWARNGWGSNWYGWAQLFDGFTVCNTNAGNPDNNCTSADHASIYFNDALYPANNPTQASGTITHEIGHVAGLAHTSADVNQNSVMHLQSHRLRSHVVSTYDIGEINRKY